MAIYLRDNIKVNGVLVSNFNNPPSPTFTLVTEPTNIQNNTSGIVFEIFGPSTIPTLGNTSVISSGDALVVDNVADLGGDLWRISCTCPTSLAKKFSPAGYIWNILVDAEQVSTSSLPYTPETSQDYENLINPVNTVGTLGDGYVGSPAENNDQWVHDTHTTNEAIPFDVDIEGYWVLDYTPLSTNTISFRRIDSTGTVDASDTLTISLPTGSLTQTLDDVTSNIIGDTTLVGDLSEQLDNLALTSSAEAFNELNILQDLENAVLITSGAVISEGNSNSTLEDITLFSAAINNGTLSVTLDDISSVFSGDVYLVGESDNTFDQITSVITTNQEIIGSTDVELADIFFATEGQITLTGTLVETIDDITTLSGIISYGSSNTTLEDIIVVIDSDLENIANLIETSDDITSSTISTVVVGGDILEDLDDVTSISAIEVTTSGSIIEILDDITLATTSLPERLSVIKYVVHILKNNFGG